MEALARFSTQSIPSAAAHHPNPRRRRRQLSSPLTSNSPIFISRFPILPLTPSPFASSHGASISSVGAIQPSTAAASLNVDLGGGDGGIRNWVIEMERPQEEEVMMEKSQIVNYYVETLQRVLGNERDARGCIYDASCGSHFGFSCTIDEETSRALARLPEVLSVRPDWNVNSAEKDYSHTKPSGVRGVLSVAPDDNFESNNKNYGGDCKTKSVNSMDSPSTTKTTEIDRKKLFVMGLSFYTSEKTLRAAFEPFGELIQATIIMDKISKRSKGYAFIEYTNEEAASAALKEMNGKVINGWMISVEVARSKPWYSKRSPRSEVGMRSPLDATK